MSSTIPHVVATAAAVSLCTLTVGACGGSEGGVSTPTSDAPASGAVAGVRDQVPAAIRKQGTLIVAADATYPPNEFVGGDGKTVVGMDADLAKALAGEMGLKAEVKNATFDSIIPGLAAHKFDLGMSSFTDTKEREKTVDFVTYFTAGTSFFTSAKKPVVVNTLADLCGKVVAVEKGTTQQTDATAQSKKCGASKVDVLTFPDQNGANLALASGRAQVGMADSPVADYQVQRSGGQFKLVGQPYGTAPYGIAISKDSGMTHAVKAALEQVIKSGEYTRILHTWSVDSGALKTPVIDGATS